MRGQILIFTVVAACALAAGCTTTSQPRRDTVAKTCIKDTGTRIPTQPPGHCLNEPGNAYSQEDLQRTGQVEVQDALRMLDPSITVHH